MINYTLLETPLTCVGIVACDGELTDVRLLDGPASAAAERMRREFPDARPDRNLLPKLQRQMQAYFAGHDAAFDVAVRLEGVTDFQRKVLTACGRIPFGRTLTYGQLAARLGSPKGARAIGNALARNPVPIVIPCHRVVASGGALGGFSAEAGVALKKQLLALENADRESGLSRSPVRHHRQAV